MRILETVFYVSLVTVISGYNHGDLLIIRGNVSTSVSSPQVAKAILSTYKPFSKVYDCSEPSTAVATVMSIPALLDDSCYPPRDDHQNAITNLMSLVYAVTSLSSTAHVCSIRFTETIQQCETSCWDCEDFLVQPIMTGTVTLTPSECQALVKHGLLPATYDDKSITSEMKRDAVSSMEEKDIGLLIFEKAVAGHPGKDGTNCRGEDGVSSYSGRSYEDSSVMVGGTISISKIPIVLEDLVDGMGTLSLKTGVHGNYKVHRTDTSIVTNAGSMLIWGQTTDWGCRFAEVVQPRKYNVSNIAGGVMFIPQVTRNHDVNDFVVMADAYDMKRVCGFDAVKLQIDGMFLTEKAPDSARDVPVTPKLSAIIAGIVDYQGHLLMRASAKEMAKLAMEICKNKVSIARIALHSESMWGIPGISDTPGVKVYRAGDVLYKMVCSPAHSAMGLVVNQSKLVGGELCIKCQMMWYNNEAYFLDPLSYSLVKVTSDISLCDSPIQPIYDDKAGNWMTNDGSLTNIRVLEFSYASATVDLMLEKSAVKYGVWDQSVIDQFGKMSLYSPQGLSQQDKIVLSSIMTSVPRSYGGKPIAQEAITKIKSILDVADGLIPGLGSILTWVASFLLIVGIVREQIFSIIMKCTRVPGNCVRSIPLYAPKGTELVAV